MSNKPVQAPGPSCPGSAMRQWKPETAEPKPQQSLGSVSSRESTSLPKAESELGQWPVQLMLVPTFAPYLKEADLAVTADCVPFAYANFHQDFLKGRPIVVGCPKLDNLELYVDRLAEIFSLNNLKAMEVLVMEVPCCSGLAQAAIAARKKAGVVTPLRITTIGVRGEHLGTEEIPQ